MLMRREPSSLLRLLSALALCATLGACNEATLAGQGPITDDPAIRHPIVVGKGLATLDILPGGGPGGLTDRQLADVQSFALEWRARGRGPLALQIPTGGADSAKTRASLPAVRSALAGAGVPSRAIRESRYAAEGPAHLAPLRLAFPVIEARVPHPCGEWPADAGSGGHGSENLAYENFGCASQQNLAAMVADPEDFIRPRPETPADASRRATVMGKYRKGESTATTYPDSTIKISDVGN
jgi:pilus assembly protein CpaD